MKISLITVCYNAGKTLEDTLISVQNQSYNNIEHIVIDGASTDDTVELIRKYESGISSWTSEPDKGIYEAMNKGLSQATGDVIGFLNADDLYADSKVLERIAKAMCDPEIDACYTDLVYVSRNDVSRIVRYWKSCDYHEDLHKKGWIPPHLTFFARKSVYDMFSHFDTTFVLAADFELLLRFLFIHKVSAKYLPMVSVKMRLGGATNMSFGNIVKQNLEILKAYRDNNVKISLPYFLVSKFGSRAKQFILNDRKRHGYK